MITKQAEIATLNALSMGRGYFSDAFTPDDVNQMVANIESDFNILHLTGIGCKLDEAELLKRQYIAAVQAMREAQDESKAAVSKAKVTEEKLSEVMKALLIEAPSSLIAYSNFEINDIVAFKIEKELPLVEEDRDYIKWLLKSKQVGE